MALILAPNFLERRYDEIRTGAKVRVEPAYDDEERRTNRRAGRGNSTPLRHRSWPDRTGAERRSGDDRSSWGPPRRSRPSRPRGRFFSRETVAPPLPSFSVYGGCRNWGGETVWKIGVYPEIGVPQAAKWGRRGPMGRF